MKWPFGKPKRQEPDAPTQLDHDQLHDRVRDQFMDQRERGEHISVGPDEKLRLTWLCGKCAELHQTVGNAEQIQNTMTAFLAWGFPFMEVTNSAFAEIAALDGNNLSTPESREAIAQEYGAFLARTKG